MVSVHELGVVTAVVVGLPVCALAFEPKVESTIANEERSRAATSNETILLGRADGCCNELDELDFSIYACKRGVTV